MRRPVYLRSPLRLEWAVLLFAFALLALGIGLRDPWPADEPRFALVAKEMLETGQFWIPHRAGELYPDKPPVFMWLTAGAIALTGSVRWGFLLPSLLAGMGTLWLVMDLLRRLYGPRLSALGGAALLLTFMFVLQAKTAQIDMLLTFFTTLGAYGLLRHALLGPARGWWLLAWGAVGAGILTKGVGFLPLLMLPAWLFLARQGRMRAPTWREVALGLAMMLAVLALWGLPMLLMAASGNAELAAYRDNILFKQTGERYVASWHHLKPWWYYVTQVLPWAWLPWVLALPWAVPAWIRRVRRGDARIILPLSGTILIVVFFSLSPGKRGVYMSPTVPLLVLALAPLLPGLLCKRGLHWLGALLLAVLAITLLATGSLGVFGLDALERLAQRYEIEPWSGFLLLGAAAAALLIGLRPRRGMMALAIWLVIFWAVWSTWVYGLMNDLRSPGYFMSAVLKATGPNAQLALPNFDEEFILMARQDVVHFGFRTPEAAQLQRAYDWLNQDPAHRWMLTEQKRKAVLSCVDLSQARDMGHQNSDDWWLIPGSAFVRCPGNANAAPLYEVSWKTADHLAAP